MSILHPTTAERIEHREYQRKLAASGIIPPRAATRPRTCMSCAYPFAPGEVGVTRWPETDGEVRYSATCPNCRATHTVHVWRPQS